MAGKWGRGRKTCLLRYHKVDENDFHWRRVGRGGHTIPPNHLEPGREVNIYHLLLAFVCKNEIESIEE